jgi:hypothetical protein
MAKVRPAGLPIAEGKGKPRLTFESQQAYHAWLKDAMSGSQDD